MEYEERRRAMRESRFPYIPAKFFNCMIGGQQTGVGLGKCFVISGNKDRIVTPL